MRIKYLRDGSRLIGAVVGLDNGRIGVSICHDKPTYTVGGLRVEVKHSHGDDVCVLFPAANQLKVVKRKAVKVSRDTFTKKAAVSLAVERANKGESTVVPHRLVCDYRDNLCDLSDIVSEEVERMTYRLQAKPTENVNVETLTEKIVRLLGF